MWKLSWKNILINTITAKVTDMEIALTLIASFLIGVIVGAAFTIDKE